MGQASPYLPGTLHGGSILLAEDDPILSRRTADVLRRRGWEVATVADGESAVREARTGAYGVVLLDIQLPELDGLQVLDAIRAGSDPPPIIMLSGYLDVKTTLAALRRGAAEILEKPVEIDRLVQAIREVERQGGASGRDDSHAEVPEILGRSPAAQRLREDIAEAARHPGVPVLVIGETGTGKELVAAAIHRLGGAAGPLVAFNCAAVPADLFESELFGHEPGAFTGARVARAGLLQAAGDGTVFLDEIGEMPANQQSKLLRVLETRSFRRLGAHRELPLRARIVSATNRPLRGRDEDPVRADLFFRLAGYTLRTPPLRERMEDVEMLATHFLHKLADEHPGVPRRLSPRAADALRSHDWPGNVRELRAVTHAAALRAPGEALGVRYVVEALSDRGCLDPQTRPPPPSALTPVAEPGLREVERDLVERAWAQSDGNLSRAARQLGIPRTTLRDKLKRYGLL
ncbi:MAG: sigma-54-dependent Fis family transcriptional regulator [Sandaracinaceae bacterium]|nr:sigma-54-dependent Fis family transcriptional regulator [Sandaracinaceae bacterium]